MLSIAGLMAVQTGEDPVAGVRSCRLVLSVTTAGSEDSARKISRVREGCSHRISYNCLVDQQSRNQIACHKQRISVSLHGARSSF